MGTGSALNIREFSKTLTKQGSINTSWDLLCFYLLPVVPIASQNVLAILESRLSMFLWTASASPRPAVFESWLSMCLRTASDSPYPCDLRRVSIISQCLFRSVFVRLLWLLLAAPSCSWLLLAASGCFWLLLAASGCFWLPLTAPGCV